jgi:hypothetical protein
MTYDRSIPGYSDADMAALHFIAKCQLETQANLRTLIRAIAAQEGVVLNTP